MRYEGNIYRPPSEARSLIVQVTIGCAHNDCTFCSMYKDKTFRVREAEEVIEDLEGAAKFYGSIIRRIFLADGDALCLSNDKLLHILNNINRLFPDLERTSVYGAPHDVLRKSHEELVELREAGIGIIYIGAESGNEEVLKNVKKGASRQEIIDSVKMIEEAGIEASVTFISGLGGQTMWKEHAIDTGTMISEMQPSYVGLLTLMLEPLAPLTRDVKEGKFKILTPEQVVAETYLMLKNINVNKNCVFRSNHASNYLSLKGDLPVDKERMLGQLEHAMKNTDILKDERFRLL